MDTINSIHSVSVQEKNVDDCHDQLSRYNEKYKMKFNDKTKMYVNQIMRILVLLKRYLNDGASSCMLHINAFADAVKIDHINLFKLQNFIKESKIANKVRQDN